MLHQLCPLDLKQQYYFSIWPVSCIDPRPLSSGKFAVYVRTQPGKEDELRLVRPDELSTSPAPMQQLDFMAKLTTKARKSAAKAA